MGAFLQLYREEGFYLERTCHYLARVGLDYVKAQIVDNPEKRQALYERLLYSLQGVEDPWQKAVATQDREYAIMEMTE